MNRLPLLPPMLLFLLLFAACGGGPSTYVPHDRSFSFTVPAGWQLVTSSAQLERLERRNPDVFANPSPFQVTGTGHLTCAFVDAAGRAGVITRQSLTAGASARQCWSKLSSQFDELPSPPTRSNGTASGNYWRHNVDGHDFLCAANQHSSNGTWTVLSCGLVAGDVLAIVIPGLATDQSTATAMLDTVLDGLRTTVPTDVPTTVAVEAPCGFFTGLWHGALSIPRLICSLFFSVDVYADNNNGTGYAVGFVLGALVLLLGRRS